MVVGWTAWGEGFLDRRHPHTLVHEPNVSSPPSCVIPSKSSVVRRTQREPGLSIYRRRRASPGSVLVMLANRRCVGENVQHDRERGRALSMFTHCGPGLMPE